MLKADPELTCYDQTGRVELIKMPGMKKHVRNHQSGFTVPSFLGVVGAGALLSWVIPTPWNVLAMVGMAVIILLDVVNNDEEG